MIESDQRQISEVFRGVQMLTIGDARFRIETGAEYSVINEDDFGTRGLFKFNIIPIIPRPIKNPIFGGG